MLWRWLRLPRAFQFEASRVPNQPAALEDGKDHEFALQLRREQVHRLSNLRPPGWPIRSSEICKKLLSPPAPLTATDDNSQGSQQARYPPDNLAPVFLGNSSQMLDQADCFLYNFDESTLLKTP